MEDITDYTIWYKDEQGNYYLRDLGKIVEEFSSAFQGFTADDIIGCRGVLYNDENAGNACLLDVFDNQGPLKLVVFGLCGSFCVDIPRDGYERRVRNRRFTEESETGGEKVAIALGLAYNWGADRKSCICNSLLIQEGVAPAYRWTGNTIINKGGKRVMAKSLMLDGIKIRFPEGGYVWNYETWKNVRVKAYYFQNGIVKLTDGRVIRLNGMCKATEPGEIVGEEPKPQSFFLKHVHKKKEKKPKPAVHGNTAKLDKDAFMADVEAGVSLRKLAVIYGVSAQTAFKYKKLWSQG